MPARPIRAIRLLVAATAASLAAAAPATAASPAAERVADPAAEVRDYWTPERMRAAEPVEEAVPAATPPGDPAPVIGGLPAAPVPPLIARPVPDPAAGAMRMHGRVFFTVGEGAGAKNYSCSGTAAASRSRRVVWTAAHCMFERGRGYVNRWTFVPGYQDGAAPFGEWPARELLVAGRYRRFADLRYDFGAAVVARNAAGQRIQDAVGARRIAFNQPRRQTYSAYGYPVVGTFEGNRRAYTCASPERNGDRYQPNEPRPLAITCDMTGGASGGGWINPEGRLLSVTSYGYPTDPLTLYGPYLGDAAQRVFRKVAGKPKPKRGGKGGKGGKR